MKRSLPSSNQEDVSPAEEFFSPLNDSEVISNNSTDGAAGSGEGPKQRRKRCAHLSNGNLELFGGQWHELGTNMEALDVAALDEASLEITLLEGDSCKVLDALEKAAEDAVDEKDGDHPRTPDATDDSEVDVVSLDDDVVFQDGCRGDLQNENEEKRAPKRQYSNDRSLTTARKVICDMGQILTSFELVKTKSFKLSERVSCVERFSCANGKYKSMLRQELLDAWQCRRGQAESLMQRKRAAAEAKALVDAR